MGEAYWVHNSKPHRQGFWRYRSNQQRYLDFLGKQLNYTNHEDWYNVKCSDFVANGGTGLLNIYGGSPSAVITNIYDTYKWEFWKFAQVPQGFWRDKANHRKFMDWVGGSELGIKKYEDWYQVPHSKIAKHAGRLFEHYNFSHISAITTIYNEHKWEPWKFSYVPQGFWEDRGNQKVFLLWLGKTLNFKHMSDWYKVKSGDFYKHKGAVLLRYYKESVSIAVMKVLTDHKWEPWRFLYSRAFLYDKEYIKSFVGCMEKELHLRDFKGWNNLSTGIITTLERLPFSRFYSGLPEILLNVYPNHEWKLPSFKIIAKYQQNLLKNMVSQLLPTSEVMQDYKHPDMKYITSNENVQFDIFVPALKLAFEYQGEQHFRQNVEYSYQSILSTIRRDIEKKVLCSTNGISLIVIPYWWDMKKDTLISLVNKNASITKPALLLHLTGN